MPISHLRGINMMILVNLAEVNLTDRKGTGLILFHDARRFSVNFCRTENESPAFLQQISFIILQFCVPIHQDRNSFALSLCLKQSGMNITIHMHHAYLIKVLYNRFNVGQCFENIAVLPQVYLLHKTSLLKYLPMIMLCIIIQIF